MLSTFLNLELLVDCFFIEKEKLLTSDDENKCKK